MTNTTKEKTELVKWEYEIEGDVFVVDTNPLTINLLLKKIRTQKNLELNDARKLINKRTELAIKSRL